MTQRIAVGTRFGAYEILEAIGAGGFGEVFRARDTRLGRIVALKVLPSTDPERRARFVREARAIAALQHPHICTLHDLGSERGTDFLVLEHVEGETLSARIARGAIPMPMALTIVSEIADALDAAHRAGIAHRDLKPANVMLTKTGTKLLDFGLAHSIETDANAGAATRSVSLTQPGVVVGTPPYMAPEQLEGRSVDGRADIFAAGCILFEMLTGRRAFDGVTRTTAPSLSAAMPGRAPINPGAMRRVEALIAACLATNANDRVRDAHDLKLALQWIAEDADSGPSAAPRSRRAIVAACVAILAVVIAQAWWAWPTQRSAPASGAVLSILAPPGVRLFPGSGPVISPDGRRVVFAGGDAKFFGLWMRSLDSAESTPIAGTDGSIGPF